MKYANDGGDEAADGWIPSSGWKYACRYKFGHHAY